ncbi:MAG: hypothetical protein ABIR37_01230 [Candidatus Saccharimonadales bacterium]
MEVEPITNNEREKFGPSRDRVLVFDPKEMLVLKRAALKRIHYRREAGLEPIRHDTNVCNFDSEILRVVIDGAEAGTYAFMLEEVAENLAGNSSDILSQRLSASCTELARSLMIANIEFDEIQSFDPNVVNWQSGAAS